MGAVYDCTRCNRLIEAVEINYIFVDKNQQSETDNIFFLNAENKFRMPLPQYGNS